jgi:glycosyltransferase involved in cell wall biosynthesis
MQVINSTRIVENSPASARRRPRVLYFIVSYPTFSETYMHEEIRSVVSEFDVKIITYRRSENPRQDSFPFELIEYTDPCLVYGRIESINREMNSPTQQEFVRKVGAVIEEFKPDVMHGHYLGLGLLLSKLAERHHIPFTIRTHSMDVLSEPREKLQALCEAANDPWCLRVLAFPSNRDRLLAEGLLPEKVVSCWPVVNFSRFHRPERRAPTGRILCVGPAIPKKAHGDFVDLAASMRDRGLAFDLYGAGPSLSTTHVKNLLLGQPVTITYEDPANMPEVYRRYDWLVYPSSQQINKVGLPVAIAEAQASGLGVCWQELPGRREEQLAYLGGGGFLFRSISEVPDILSRPYSEEMRQKGFAAARRCDIEQHKSLLTEMWALDSGGSAVLGHLERSRKAGRRPSRRGSSRRWLWRLVGRLLRRV